MSFGVDKLRKVVLFLLILSIFILSGCEEVANDELWNSIVDTEFGAGNFMGESIYFYEEDSVKYCDFWMSGSGVPAIFFYTSIVEIDGDGNVAVDTPTIFLGTSGFNDDFILERVIIEYTEGSIYLNDVIYEDFDVNTRDQAIEWWESK